MKINHTVLKAPLSGTLEGHLRETFVPYRNCFSSFRPDVRPALGAGLRWTVHDTREQSSLCTALTQNSQET